MAMSVRVMLSLLLASAIGRDGRGGEEKGGEERRGEGGRGDERGGDSSEQYTKACLNSLHALLNKVVLTLSILEDLQPLRHP